MSETSLRSILNTPPAKKDYGAVIRSEEEPEYRAFAFGRVSIRPQLMIEFSKADGFHLILPYMDIKSISTPDPSKGFILEFSGRKITIEGNNLTNCFRYMRENRVAILVEADRVSAMQEAETEPVIYRITYGKNKPAKDED